MAKRKGGTASGEKTGGCRTGACPTSTTAEPTEPTASAADNVSSDTKGKGSMLNKALLSVVKVFTTATFPNYSMPWQMKRQQKSTSSGFAIEGRRILTNAHSVANQTLVQVRKHGSFKKHAARVLAVGHECDIAMLEVVDDAEEFWENMLPLSFGDLPDLQDPVTVIGYPTGGDNICVTRGVVSRIEIQTYSHASMQLLSIQIDAAINSGNSGGPALLDDKVVGIAFETLTDADNIGYVIPTTVIEHFLEDIRRNGKYTGFCDLGHISFQMMESKMLRGWMKMAPTHNGVLINHFSDTTTEVAKVLKKHDVLLAFDGVPIADDGTVPFRHGERISYKMLVSSKYVGESCTLQVLRNGKVIDVKTTVGVSKLLVPVHQFEMLPDYYIYGGLVFCPLSRPYLQNEYGKDWECKCTIQMCNKAVNGVITGEGEEVVILSQVLSDEINAGYQSMLNAQVFAVNGTPVKNLQHLVAMCLDHKGEYVVFTLEKDKIVAMACDQARDAMDRITKMHGIPSVMSEKLNGIFHNQKNKNGSAASALASAAAAEPTGRTLASAAAAAAEPTGRTAKKGRTNGPHCEKGEALALPTLGRLPPFYTEGG